MRSVYLNKKNYLSLEQGAIISGCVATGYKNCDVYGCVITARCDLAHSGKVSVVHYLPVVSFSDWFRVYARQILFNQWEIRNRNNINRLFKEGKKGDDVLDLNLSSKELVILAESIANKKNRDNALQCLHEFFDNREESFTRFLNEEKTFKDFFIPLIKGDKHEFYYIEDWVNSEAAGRIILLKDIKSISYDLAIKLPGGIEEAETEKYLLMENSLATTDDNSGFYMVENQVSSPFIEHILQAFSYGFNRIGVDDINLEAHCNRIKQQLK